MRAADLDPETVLAFRRRMRELDDEHRRARGPAARRRIEARMEKLRGEVRELERLGVAVDEAARAWWEETKRGLDAALGAITPGMSGDAKRPGDRLTNEDYLTIQQQLAIFGGAVAVLDLEAFLDRISLAETAGPVLDPTAWTKGHERLAAVKELAEGALKFKHAAAKYGNTMQRLDAAAAAKKIP